MPEIDAASMLIRFWRLHGAPVSPPVSDQNIRKFQRDYDVVLPEDFRNYLLSANGTVSDLDYQDHNGFAFWPIERICPVYQFDGGQFSQPEFDRCFLFADLLDFCFGYGIQLSSKPGQNSILLVGDKDDRPLRVAHSFTEFVQYYVADSPVLYSGQQGESESRR